ncbi:MAG: hypothetical protein Q9214_005686 [Letrouitia sp. 1 TL-2023]
MMLPELEKGKYINPNSIIGPPEAFFPFHSINADGSSAADLLQGLDDEENGDSGEDVLDVGAFVDFGNDSDEGGFESSQGNAGSSIVDDYFKWLKLAIDPTLPLLTQSADGIWFDHSESEIPTAYHHSQNQHGSQTQQGSSGMTFPLQSGFETRRNLPNINPLSHHLRKRTLSGSLGIRNNYKPSAIR